jgi:hypothetical protein
MNIKNLLNHISKCEQDAPLHERLIDIYSGNLNQYVAQELKKELSPKSFDIASKRIPSVNLLQRITDKLSNVYTDVPKRTVPDSKDQEQLDQYIESTSVQEVMAQAEVLLNLNKTFAIEPYLNNQGTFSLRLLQANEFCVYSDNIINPKEPTHFIKYMGTELKGKKKVRIYWVYTAQEFFVMNSEGEVAGQRPNEFGVIPFVYCTADNFRLMPNPDNDSYDNTVLIPKLLTDLNFAVQFQSHSLMYGIDVDVTGLSGSPDSFWSIKSEQGSDKKPQIGVLSPSVDTEKVIKLIEFTLSQWLESKGIKPGSAGNVGNNSAVSAVSKIVDEADTSAIVQANRNLLVKTEKALWRLIGVMHNALIGSATFIATRGLANPFEVSISFPTQQLIANPQEQRDQLKFQLDNRLISYRRAMKQAHPDLNDQEIEQLIAEIKAEQSPNPNNSTNN